ncbi:trichohyalin isoform X3 [Gouania willdenowi]|uniref:trichohyalin isoform X3 n=1 Tax=Gouania willdenowi TaxID=441366 RepID=UPI0010550804|nr:trichohyalin-like isoform X3 [Gouania willdenowi]
MPDHKLLPGGKMSRDPSPKPAKRAPPERDCEAIRRAESEHLKMREKTRDTFDRYYEKDKGSRLREEDREWKERERKREEERRKNGRTPENVEETGREVKGGFKKGDTFPRMRKGDADLDRRVVSSIETIEDRGGRREKDRPRRGEIYEWEPEGERKWEREKYRERQREETRVRLKDEDKTSGGRSVANERFRDREQYRMFDDGFRNRQGKEFALRDMRDKDTTYRRDKPRTYISDREARIPSPHRRKAKEMYTDSRERDKTQRDGRRDTKSEGDNDEREIRREKVRDREKKEFIYQQSKSEEDTRSKNTREKDQHWQRYRDEDRHRYRDREVDSFMRKGDEKQRERHSEDNRQATRLRDGKDEFREDRNFKDDKVQLRDRREDERYRERRQKRDGERRDIETLHRGQEKKSEDSQSRDEQTLGLPPRAQSSGEWSSDMDSEVRRRGDSYVDSNFQREHSAERKRHKDQHRDMDRAQRERMRCEQKEGRRREVAGSEAERRRMWLDPQKGNDSKEEIIDRGQKERMKNEEKNIESQVEQRKAKEEQNERYMDQSNNKEIEGWSYKFGRDLERESKEVSVDEEDECQLLRQVDMEDDEYLSDSDGEIERSYPRYIEGENVTDDTEESDTGEVGGTDNWVRSENEVGSDAEWRHGQDKMLSGEDGFVTVSSGADEDYERDSDEDEFKDCQEFLEGGMAQGDHQPVGFKGHQGDEEMRTGREGKGDDVEQQREKPLVFCVIGQTIPRSNTRQISPSQGDHRVEGNDPDLESRRLVNNTIHPPDDDHHLTLIQNDKDVNNDNCNVVRECGNPKEEFTKGQHSDKDIYRASSELQGGESKAEMRSKEEDRVAEIGVIKRDSQTEKLLTEWREKIKNIEEAKTSPVPSNPYADVCSQVNLEEIQPMLDQLNSGLMSPEEVEAIRIRLSGAWSMSEEPKRHSQAPHLKWAKNVVREILGHSDEQIVDESNTEDQENKKIYLSEMKQQERIAQGTEEMTVFTLTVEEQHSDAELDDEVEGLRDEDDDRSKSWGEVELRNVLETINRRKRNSRFFNDAQLYQQYSEEAQNFEILRQTRSEVLSVCEYPTASPAPSPPPACRPLPPLPPVPHPHSISHTGSITSVKSLPLPEPPTGRSTSPRLSISLTQSASLWRDLPAVRNSTELEDFTDDQRRLQEVRFEVVTSEASYCRSLDIVVEHFVKSKQLNALLGTQDRNWLFSRLADVRAISHSFLSKLEERVESNMMHFTVCDIIAKHCQRFKMVYVPYLTNQSYQDATYQRLMNENPGFRRIVEKLERSPVCQRLPLRSFLVLPFQRITRIKLLVQNIVKRTAPGTAEAMQGIKALRLVEKLIQESNDSITQMKSIESLVSLSAKVDFECRTLPLISQSRRMVREGLVTELMDFSLKDTERNVYMHLFNDYLLLSLQKEGRYLVIDHAPVSELRAENCRVKLHSLQKNLFKLHMSGKALLLRTDTQSDKLRWISALSRPHPEIDFSAAQDFAQMQCIRAFVAQQPDELSLEKADVILVHQQSSDNWVEGTRLSDRHRGWVPNSHLETITNSRVRQRNLSDALKLTTATAAV